MSKTSQRKRSLYQMGVNDAREGWEFPRWARHPLKRFYMQGFAKTIGGKSKSGWIIAIRQKWGMP